MVHDPLPGKDIACQKPERFAMQDIVVLYAKVPDTIVTEGVVFANIFKNERVRL